MKFFNKKSLINTMALSLLCTVSLSSHAVLIQHALFNDKLFVYIYPLVGDKCSNNANDKYMEVKMEAATEYGEEESFSSFRVPEALGNASGYVCVKAEYKTGGMSRYCIVRTTVDPDNKITFIRPDYNQQTPEVYKRHSTGTYILDNCNEYNPTS